MIQIYRAKSKATDEWATGYLVKGYAGLRIDAFILPLKNISAYPSADLSRIWAEGIEVDASTICAYTGLADNLKCDIYEWDIVGATIILTEYLLSVSGGISLRIATITVGILTVRYNQQANILFYL